MKHRFSPVGVFNAAITLSALLLAGCTSFGGAPSQTSSAALQGERIDVLPDTKISGGRATVSGAVIVTDWSQPGGRASNAPFHAALTNPKTIEWKTRGTSRARARNARNSAPPLVHGGRAFTYDPSGVVHAYSLSGASLWRAEVAPEGEDSRVTGGGIAASRATLFAATGFGEVVALDVASGGQRWRYDLGEPARSAPTVEGGLLYVVTKGNVLHVINRSDGTEAWTYPGIPEGAGVVASASPAVSRGIVVVPYSSGELIAFDARSGKPKWSDVVVRSSRTLAVSTLTDIAAAPVIAGGIVYATGVAGRTIAVDLASGERLWEVNLGSAATPVVSGNSIFLVDLEDNLVALDRRNGAIIYQRPLPKIRKRRFFSVWHGPTLAGNALWIVSNNGRLLGANPADGSVITERKLSKASFTKPIAAGGRLIVQGGDGSLTAF